MNMSGTQCVSLGGAVLGIGIYSLGINVPVGLTVAAVYGCVALKDKAHAAWQEKHHQATYETDLKCQSNKSMAKLWLTSAIPIIGPAKAIFTHMGNTQS
jgi:hypothetical protein